MANRRINFSADLRTCKEEETMTEEVVKRKKTLLEQQKYYLGYGFGISIFSPSASLYQLLKLNPTYKLTPTQGVKMAMRILPHQTLLKVTQMNVSYPVRDYVNTWAAFGLVGILQGGVYGQANIYFVKSLKMPKKVTYAGLFRGYGFAGLRDMLSQGIPYVFASTVEREVADKLITSESEASKSIKKWGSVISTSIVATYLSQGFHNCQVTMHSDHSLNHLTALRQAIKNNGISLLYKGGEARVSLLLVVNVLNEVFLKKAWE